MRLIDLGLQGNEVTAEDPSAPSQDQPRCATDGNPGSPDGFVLWGGKALK